VPALAHYREQYIGAIAKAVYPQGLIGDFSLSSKPLKLSNLVYNLLHSPRGGYRSEQSGHKLLRRLVLFELVVGIAHQYDTGITLGSDVNTFCLSPQPDCRRLCLRLVSGCLGCKLKAPRYLGA
jgi:hypothetical protein